MSTESIWQTYSQTTDFPRLIGDETVDVVIIGGGMTGLMTAYYLKEQGKKVAVFESHAVGISNTGHSTGNLYEVMGSELLEIRKKYGPQIIRKLVASRREGVNAIEKVVERFGIECDFIRVPWFYYASSPDRVSDVEKHHHICQEVGLDIKETTMDHPAFKAIKAIRMDRQAQFNPLRFAQGLAKAINDKNCMIYERTTILDVHEEEDRCELVTEHGRVHATFVVHATHTPKGIMPYHTLLEPVREYGIACRIRDPQHPLGIHFGLHSGTAHFSTRVYERSGEHYLVVVGAPHKVGHGDTNHQMRILEGFASSHFEVTEFTHRWGGQHYKPADELPYIGRKGAKSNTFVATGFSTHGLVYGTIAAQIITDQIMDRENKYADIYSAVRFTPMKSVKKFIKDNASVFTDLVKDYLVANKAPFADVAPGEGKVLAHEGHRLAVYRDETEGLKVCSAVCTHMGCLVRWNNDERSWDCPCHGSRFGTDGEVLEGPALHALAKAELVDDDTPLRNPIQIIKDNLSTGLGT